MYIKYLGNIHNIDNYQSIVKGTPLKEIRLLKDSHSITFVFDDVVSRDWVLSKIWIEIQKETKFFDLDADLELYYSTIKYNV